MIAARAHLDRLLVAADPLERTTPTAPDVDDEVRAALAWDERYPAAVVASPRSRRTLVGAVAVVGLAAAAALVVPLLTPSGSPLAAPSAVAVELRAIAASTRATAVTTATTSTYHDRGIDVASTPTGDAFYWQEAMVTRTVTRTEDTWTFAFSAPRYLTPGDERKASALPPADRPTIGTTTQRLSTSDVTWPTREALAALPTTATALAGALPTDMCSGRYCRVDQALTIIAFPGTTAALRAAALDLLAATPGVTVLGPRVVNGHAGLALHVGDGSAREATDSIYVIDTSDGTELAQYDYATPTYLASIPMPVAPGALVWQRERTD
jgi:hypothetical protein